MSWTDDGSHPGRWLKIRPGAAGNLPASFLLYKELGLC